MVTRPYVGVFNLIKVGQIGQEFFPFAFKQAKKTGVITCHIQPLSGFCSPVMGGICTGAWNVIGRFNV
jgi:hypothetical protein